MPKAVRASDTVSADVAEQQDEELFPQADAVDGGRQHQEHYITWQAGDLTEEKTR